MRAIFFFLFFLIFGVAEAQKYTTMQFADDIKVKVPKEFTPMTAEDKTQRYESSRIPIAILTDPERMAELGINRSFSIWADSDLDLLQQFYEASILELYDRVNFIDKGVKNINGLDFAFFEFESAVYPENNFQGNISKYTYLSYCLHGGTTYVFDFTCEIGVKQQWIPVAHKILESVKIK